MYSLYVLVPWWCNCRANTRNVLSHSLVDGRDNKIASRRPDGCVANPLAKVGYVVGRAGCYGLASSELHFEHGVSTGSEKLVKCGV